MNPLFEEVAGNEAKDLVNFLIMTLHEELNKANKNDINQNDIKIDESNQIQVFQNFSENFFSKNQSIITDLFFAINCNITECGNCHSKIFNYQIYFFLVFPLEEILNFRNQYNIFSNQFKYYNQNNMNIQNNNEVNIYDCFNYDKKVNIMSGDNAMYCNICKVTCSSSIYTCLVTGPEILIIYLNRENGKQFNIKLLYEEYLNLYNYIEYNNTGFNYKLIAVLTHNNGNGGIDEYFIADCRDPITQKWHKYKDTIVTEVSNFQTEVLNSEIPSLLLYQKVN